MFRVCLVIGPIAPQFLFDKASCFESFQPTLNLNQGIAGSSYDSRNIKKRSRLANGLPGKIFSREARELIKHYNSLLSTTFYHHSVARWIKKYQENKVSWKEMLCYHINDYVESRIDEISNAWKKHSSS